MTDYSPIIEMLEKADGPDRGDDWMIHCVNGLWGAGLYGNHPDYTDSLDASIALCEQVTPANRAKFVWCMEIMREALRAWFLLEEPAPLKDGLARQVLLAMFRALQAQETASDD